MLTKKISFINKVLIDYLFPLNCSFCGGVDWYTQKLSICKNCVKKNDVVISERCYICKTLIVEDNCNYCSTRNIFFERLEFLHNRDEFHKEIINRIKFQNEIFLANYFRLGLNRKWNNFKFPNFDYVTSIPSNRKTRIARPYSPIDSVLKFITEKLKIKEENFLEKCSDEKQSEKSFHERFFHARKAFQIKEKFKNKISGNILLLDDIFTTGASMNEASRVLIENGAEKIFLLALVKGDIL